MMGIVCAYCGGETRVNNTVVHTELIVRYRKCKQCELMTRTEERHRQRNIATYSKPDDAGK
jgi:transcription elongation factor Elf1